MNLKAQGGLCPSSVPLLPVLYGLHVFAAVALVLRGLPLAGGLLDVGQHVGHQRLLQPLPDAVHQLLLFPAHKRNRKSLGGDSWSSEQMLCFCTDLVVAGGTANKQSGYSKLGWITSLTVPRHIKWESYKHKTSSIVPRVQLIFPLF